MAKPLSQLNKQIALLQRQADVIKKKDAKGVIARIKEAIATYHLTAEDLGFGAAPTNPIGVAAKKRLGSHPATKATKSKTSIKYRDEAGNQWSGRGRRPQWYLDAIAAGKTPEQLAS